MDSGYPFAQPISDKVTLFTQALAPEVNPRSRPEADTVTPWIQVESAEENAWTEAGSETCTPLIMEFKPWIETVSDIVTPGTKYDFSEAKLGILPEAGTFEL